MGTQTIRLQEISFGYFGRLRMMTQASKLYRKYFLHRQNNACWEKDHTLHVQVHKLCDLRLGTDLGPSYLLLEHLDP